MKKQLFIILGVLSLILGIVGIFIPLLPTTPFLLLAAALFFRGSEKLYAWLINHRIFGNYIRNFREHNAIPLSTKIYSITTLWALILYSVVFILQDWYFQAGLIIIAIAVTIHILHYKTLKKDKTN